MWEQSAIRVALSSAGKLLSHFTDRLRKRGIESDRRRASQHKQELASVKRAEAERSEARALCDVAIRALHAAAQDEKRLKWNIYDRVDQDDWVSEKDGELYGDKRKLYKAIEKKEAIAEQAYQEALQPARAALTALSPYLQKNIVLSFSPSSYELEQALDEVKQCREQGG
ncbi:hypothetical protein [Streptomyces halstedii]|uniref:hypothetical protein n=1 Tax=Streptomyces halstedii TaxID=1944 RepID=UPI00380CC80E